MHRILRIFLLLLTFNLSLTTISAEDNDHKQKGKPIKPAKNIEPDMMPVQASAEKVFPCVYALNDQVSYINDQYKEGIDVSRYQGSIDWKKVAESSQISYVYLKATEGESLLDKTYLRNLEEAKKAYEESKTLQKNLVEFEVQQKALQQEIAKEERDTIFIEVIQKRINDLYNAITSDEAFVALNDAQAEVNELMNAVNTTITYNITGEMPSSCTHDCSTCGGGCH